MASPRIIGRYEVLDRLGKGGMGEVYLARDPNIARLVALKLLPGHLDSDELRERFTREARAAGALGHPNIVTVHDFGEWEGAPYLVMEYIPGETLAQTIKRRAPVSLERKLQLLEQLCAGLGYAHAAGVIHRDVKPANLMVDQHGFLKILDFGIARLVDSQTRLTVAAIGTPRYMSPEQIDGGEIDARSDVFSVGAVAFELLTYTEAFAGDTTIAVMRRVQEYQPPPVSTLCPEAGPEIDAIVVRALEKDVRRRFPHIRSMQAGLQQAISHLGAGSGDLAAAATATSQPTLRLEGADAQPAAGPTSDDLPISGEHRRVFSRYRAGPVYAALSALVLLLVVGGLTWWRASAGQSAPGVPVAKEQTTPQPAGAGGDHVEPAALVAAGRQGPSPTSAGTEGGGATHSDPPRQPIGPAGVKVAPAERSVTLEDHLARADSLRAAGQYRAAVAEYEVVLSEDPRNQRAREGRAAAVEARIMNWPAAADGRGQRLGGRAEEEARLLEDADRLFAAGDYAAAVTAYERVLVISPKSERGVVGKKNAVEAKVMRGRAGR